MSENLYTILLYLMAIAFYGSGLLFWPVFRLRRGPTPRARKLRFVFFVTLSLLASLVGFLGVVALRGRFNHTWLPVTILFPLINLVSLVVSGTILLQRDETGET